jgi:hypothetical protein
MMVEMDRELVDSSGNQDAARIATNAPLPPFKLAKYCLFDVGSGIAPVPA